MWHPRFPLNGIKKYLSWSDTTGYTTLLTRPKHTVWIHNTALVCFKSYLIDWFRAMSVDNTQSHPVKVCWGVPQGSFLGTHTHTHTHTLSLSLSLTHTHTHTKQAKTTKPKQKSTTTTTTHTHKQTTNNNKTNKRKNSFTLLRYIFWLLVGLRLLYSRTFV